MRERNAFWSTDNATGDEFEEGMRTMRKIGLAAVVAASVAATGCATYPDQYGYNDGYYNNGYYNNGYNNGYYDQYGYYHQYPYSNGQVGRVVGGAAVGAVGG